MKTHHTTEDPIRPNPPVPPDIPEEDEEDIDFDFEPTTRSDYLEAAYKAIKAVEDIDTGMDRELREVKNRIMGKSIRIIDMLVSEMYDELFYDEES